MAELLVRYGAVPVPPALTEMDTFIGACLRSDRAAVEAALARHPEFLRDPRPLFAAVRRDRVDVAGMLLDLGVSPDVEDTPHGRNRALHVAAASGAEKCAGLLIARGADVDFRETQWHAVPLGVASWAGQPRLIELLGRHSRDVWALTRTGRVDRLRALLDDQPELARIAAADGDTPLMWLPNDDAAALAIAALLLAHGADPARRNARGETAAGIATRRGLEEVAALLRVRGG
jgi:ankyrin repeat protein